MLKKYLRAGWHISLAGLACYEFTISSTTLRKLLCGGCAGWHAAAAVIDYQADSEVSDV